MVREGGGEGGEEVHVGEEGGGRRRGEEGGGGKRRGEEGGREGEANNLLTQYTYSCYSPVNKVDGDGLELFCTMQVCQNESVRCVLSVEVVAKSLLTHELETL